MSQRLRYPAFSRGSENQRKSQKAIMKRKKGWLLILTKRALTARPKHPCFISILNEDFKCYLFKIGRPGTSSFKTPYVISRCKIPSRATFVSCQQVRPPLASCYLDIASLSKRILCSVPHKPKQISVRGFTPSFSRPLSLLNAVASAYYFIS